MAAVLGGQCLAVSEEPGTDPCANPSTEFNGLAPLETWLHERLDRDLWNRSAEALQRQRGQSTPNQAQEALETAIRAAAAATGAIEGLYPITTGQTIMVAERAPNWQTALAGVGETAPALFEAQLAAYHLAISLDASDTGITAAGVRQLHVEFCRPQAERDTSLRLGEYKKVDNCTRKSDGTVHRYARAVEVSPQVDRLWAVMATEAFRDAHPAVQAAYVHFAFAAIHPFADGNGRVVRAVTSALLQRPVGMPLVIYADQRDRYIRALELADGGEYGSFLRFIFDRCLDSMRFVADRLAAANAPGSEDFTRLYAAHAGLTYQEVTSLAVRVVDELTNEINVAWQARNLSSAMVGFSAGIQNRGPLPPALVNSGFRGIEANQTRGTFIQLTTPHPATAMVQVSIGVFIARDVTDRFPFVIADWESPEDRLEIRLDDVYPDATTDYVMRRRAWIDRKVSHALSRLYEAAKASRGQ
jgi:Fic family protein